MVVGMQNEKDTRRFQPMDIQQGLPSITWLGHATLLLISAQGTRVLIDPWIDGNPKCPLGIDDVSDLHAIAVTHGHFDHISDAPVLARKTGAPVISNPEIAAYLAIQGIENRLEMNKGGTVTIRDVAITMVHADHSSGIPGAEGTPNIEGGEATGLIIRFAPDESPVYVAGDTNVFGDMQMIRALYQPDLGVLPIDGNYNMGPYEAAYATELLGIRRVVPIHYGTFPALWGTPSDLTRALQTRGVTCDVLAVEPGQAVVLGSKAVHDGE